MMVLCPCSENDYDNDTRDENKDDAHPKLHIRACTTRFSAQAAGQRVLMESSQSTNIIITYNIT